MLSNQTAPEVSLAAFGSGGRFVLFRHLHDDAFLAFSREHKHLYAACLLDLYDRFFTGAPAFPTPQEVTHAIYDVMRANPSLWNEGDDFASHCPRSCPRDAGGSSALRQPRPTRRTVLC